MGTHSQRKVAGGGATDCKSKRTHRGAKRRRNICGKHHNAWAIQPTVRKRAGLAWRGIHAITKQVLHGRKGGLEPANLRMACGFRAKF